MIRYETRPNPTAIMRAQPQRCHRSVVERLADDMREMGHAGEAMTVEALRLRGYSAAVLRRHGDAALSKARRLSIRRVGA